MRLAWAMATVVMGSAAAAGAEEAPRAWMIAVEPASAHLHGTASRVRPGVPGPRGRRHARRSSATGLAPGGALDAGIEARFCRSCRVSPVLGLAAVLMGEDDYGGTFARATAGLEAVLTPRLVLRATVQAGTHDGQAGPHLAAVGSAGASDAAASRHSSKTNGAQW